MPKAPLLPLPDGLEIVSVSVTDQEVQIRVNSTRERAGCPRCSTPSSVIHRSYRRTPLELPCAGQYVNRQEILFWLNSARIGGICAPIWEKQSSAFSFVSRFTSQKKPPSIRKQSPNQL